MTIQELIDKCKEEGISFDTQIALRAKDDYLLINEGAYMDGAYFGNCSDGQDWEKANTPKDKDGEMDYEKTPKVLILDTGRG